MSGLVIDCVCGQAPHAEWCASPAAFAARTGAELSFCVTHGHEQIRSPFPALCAWLVGGRPCGARVLGNPERRVLVEPVCFCCGQPRESLQAGCVPCGMSLFEVHTFNRSWLSYRYSGELPDPDRFAIV